jgi:aspartyl-tRNA(Asn)/glutamyl-tRNA(Gln) amidotransferase subunit A
MREIFVEVFKKVDAVVTPQLPITAPKIGQGSVSFGKVVEPVPVALTRFTRIYNLIGIPSLSLPCGFSSSGMPVGLQIAAKPFDEDTVLKVSHAYEINSPWKSRQPLFE